MNIEKLPSKSAVAQQIENSFSPAPPTLRSVAQALGTSPRSVQRSLQEQGTSFSELLGSVGLERASRMLQESKLNVTEIAKELGYTDPSNFCRAFHGWTGLSPHKWRKECTQKN